MQQVIVLTPDQLQVLFNDQVLRFEAIIKQSEKKEITSKEWLTAKEACSILKISQTTLFDWIKKGIIQKYTIGSRIRFRHDEVQESLTRMEAKRRRS
jgi:excisionase family DNA binding protein